MGLFYNLLSGSTQKSRARCLVIAGCGVNKLLAKVRRIVSRGKIRRILVVKPDAVGDFILATPFLRELRKAFPRAFISLVVHPRVLSLAENCPYVDRVLIFDSAVPRAATAEYRQLRSLGFALTKCSRFGVDLAVSPRSGKDYYEGYQLLLGCAPGRVATYARGLAHVEQREWKSLLPGHSILLSDESPRHEVVRNLELLKALGVVITSERLEIWPTAADKARANDWLRQLAGNSRVPQIALGIGAADEARRWPAERFADLCKFLADEFGARTILIGGGAEDAASAQNILRRVARPTVENAVGVFTLRETAALLQGCQLFIGNDSGPMHLAAAAGIPVVEISGLPEHEDPNSNYSPVRFGPWGVLSRVVRPAAARGSAPRAIDDADALRISDVTLDAVCSAARSILEEVIGRQSVHATAAAS